MIVLEFKTYAKPEQFKAVYEALIICCQLIRNNSIRLGIDGDVKSWFDISKYCAMAILAGVVKILPHPSPPRTRGSGVRNSQMIYDRYIWAKEFDEC
jgi:hypothetical protein